MGIFNDRLMENYALFQFNGMKVIPSNHSVERDMERRRITDTQWDQFFKRILIRTQKLFALGTMKLGQYLFYSQSLHQGLVADFRPERNDPNGPPQVIIITVLPPDKKLAKPGTKLVFMEVVDEFKGNERILEYLLDNLDLLGENVTYSNDMIESIALNIEVVD